MVCQFDLHFGRHKPCYPPTASGDKISSLGCKAKPISWDVMGMSWDALWECVVRCSWHFMVFHGISGCVWYILVCCEVCYGN